MMSSAPPKAPPPMRYRGGSPRPGRRLRPFVVAVTAAIALSGITEPPRTPPRREVVAAETTAPEHYSSTSGRQWSAAIRLTSAGPIDIANGISLTPAPGWTLTNRGANWVTLYNADSTARIQVEVKPAGGTDIVAELQADINRLTSTPSTGLTNVTNLTGPSTKALHSAKFQERASIDYTADISTQQGTIPVLGVFDELLNTSNLLSAFIDYRQNGEASTHSAGSGGMMINSML